VAQLGKDKHILLHDSESVVGTDLCAAPTEGAFAIVYLWDEDSYLLPAFDSRPKKKVGVGLFHVTIQKQQIGFRAALCICGYG
jgi:hypothetical protein